MTKYYIHWNCNCGWRGRSEVINRGYVRCPLCGDIQFTMSELLRQNEKEKKQ